MTAFGIERTLEQDVQRMADLVMAAAAPWSIGDTRRAQRVIGEILSESRSPYDRSALGWAVTSILHERIGVAWERHWQPIDLDRLVTRNLKRPERALLGDAMAHHLSRYASTTVDPEWWSQLAALEASVWWPSHQSYLEARGERQDWHGLVSSSVQLIAGIWAVPEIEPLGPVPGAATPRADRAGGPEVAPKILERVRRLLAKAESTTYQAEAETFTAGAQSLMARYSIDAALLAASAPSADGPVLRRVGVGNPYESPKVSLLARVAAANYSRTVWSRELGYVTLIGHHEDLDAVETLFTSLLVQATAAMTKQGTRTDARGRSRTATFRRSFLTAFAHRIGERLHEVADAEVQAVVDERTREGPSGSGRELVPLLQERRDAVDDTVDEVFPQLRMQRAAAATDVEGWSSGTAAADRASLSGATQLDG